MTQAQAIKRASKLAKRTGEDYFVVYEYGEGYQACNAFDLDTFFAGQEAVAAVGPHGLYYQDSLS